MEEKNEDKISLDVLKHIEDLSNQINEKMAKRTDGVFRRYPVTFGLLILFGVISLNEGLKRIMEKIGLLDMSPWYLILIGIVILTTTGVLYKKLDR